MRTEEVIRKELNAAELRVSSLEYELKHVKWMAALKTIKEVMETVNLDDPKQALTTLGHLENGVHHLKCEISYSLYDDDERE